jgi:hypothetical protein
MTTWEYRAVYLSSYMMLRHVGQAGGPDLDRDLNKLGAEGWEVYGGPSQDGWFFLKRPHHGHSVV